MNQSLDERTEALAAQLAAAQQTRALMAAPEPALVDEQQAYDLQHRVLALRRQSIGGWKVGAKSPSGGPIQGAPLPSAGMHASPASIGQGGFATCGLELEIAFRFGRVFEPRAQAYEEAEVLDGIASMMATIEIVSTRYIGWPAVDKLALLADLQNHGALVVGEPVAYAADFPFVAPTLSFRVDGADVVKGRVANPAGDSRRLLAWVVNHASSRGIRIDADTVVTTGSYTGMHFVERPGVVVGAIAGLPPVQLALT